MNKKINLLFLILSIAAIVPVMAAEEMGKVPYEHFVWNSMALMYFFDIAVILLALFCLSALYSVYNSLAGELKTAYTYLLVGIVPIALFHMIDLISMITNNMDFMEYLHLNVDWTITLIALISISVAFYKIKIAIQKVSPKKDISAKNGRNYI